MRTTISMLAAMIACGAAAIPEVSRAAAFYFESTMTQEGQGDDQVIKSRAWIDGASAKVEFVEGQLGFYEAGSYMLTMDGGQTIYMVDPSKMTYSEINIDQMLGFLGTIMNATGGLVQFEFSDLSNEKVAEEPGEEILGYSTTRYEYRVGYTMTMGVLGFKRTNRSETQQQFWCTDELDAEGFRLWLSPDRFRTGNAEFDELLSAEYQDLDCLPLRMHATTTMTGDDTGTSAVMTEVTLIREEGSIDASVFALPSDYTATTLLPVLPEGAAIPEELPEDTSDADQPEDGRRIPRLRDLLRR